MSSPTLFHLFDAAIFSTSLLCDNSLHTNFILIKYPIELKEALQKAFAEQSYKVKFMNEPDINTHLRITLGRPEQNRIVIDTIKEIASK